VVEAPEAPEVEVVKYAATSALVVEIPVDETAPETSTDEEAGPVVVATRASAAVVVVTYANELVEVDPAARNPEEVVVVKELVEDESSRKSTNPLELGALNESTEVGPAAKNPEEEVVVAKVLVEDEPSWKANCPFEVGAVDELVEAGAATVLDVGAVAKMLMNPPDVAEVDEDEAARTLLKAATLLVDRKLADALSTVLVLVLDIALLATKGAADEVTELKPELVGDADDCNKVEDAERDVVELVARVVDEDEEVVSCETILANRLMARPSVVSVLAMLR
jgi:hypothetical protein